MAAVFCIISTVSAFAAGGAAESAYNRVYRNTEEIELITNEAESVVEIFEILPDESINIMESNDLIDPMGINNYTWTIKKDSMMRTRDIRLSKGSTVRLYASTTSASSNDRFMLGIQQANGVMKGAAGNGTVTCNIPITTTDRYQVFVRNLSNNTITVQVTVTL